MVPRDASYGHALEEDAAWGRLQFTTARVLPCRESGGVAGGHPRRSQRREAIRGTFGKRLNATRPNTKIGITECVQVVSDCDTRQSGRPVGPPLRDVRLTVRLQRWGRGTCCCRPT